MNKKQGVNPYLPSFEYVPDGEPHIFGDRVYVYGSHDRFDGAHFCLNDYVCYSASIYDLTDWKYEGVIYRKEQDPRNQNIPEDARPRNRGKAAGPVVKENELNPPGIHAMYAPDVTQGADGRYYLYYCLDILPELAVAVCDTPAGKYEFLDFVRHEGGTILSHKEGDCFQFDPGVFKDDDGQYYLFSGNAPIFKSKGRKEGTTGLDRISQVMKLKDDMVTLASKPKRLLCDVLDSDGSGYEGHEFFEASSVRKIKGKYYFVYSSVNSHELCYAVSDKVDEGYEFGGTLVDIGDIYLNGRTAEESLNVKGNTHGSLELINGQWYVFYHRQSNQTHYSRQACAEKITLTEDGRFLQAELTSCGFNQGALSAKGEYPAYICCRLTGKLPPTYSYYRDMKDEHPYLTQDEPDFEPTEEKIKEDRVWPFQYIKNIEDKTTIGYKYFTGNEADTIKIWVRGKFSGKVRIYDDLTANPLGEIALEVNSSDLWMVYSGEIKLPEVCEFSLNFVFGGEGKAEFVKFEFI